jgi:hypothetical protein
MDAEAKPRDDGAQGEDLDRSVEPDAAKHAEDDSAHGEEHDQAGSHDDAMRHLIIRNVIIAQSRNSRT